MVSVTKAAKRKYNARMAIHKSLSLIDHGIIASLFVKRHLEELDPSYWIDHLGTATPTANDIINLLELHPHSCEHDSILEFILPGNVSSHVICVHFNTNGVVDDISIVS